MNIAQTSGPGGIRRGLIWQSSNTSGGSIGWPDEPVDGDTGSWYEMEFSGLGRNVLPESYRQSHDPNAIRRPIIIPTYSGPVQILDRIPNGADGGPYKPWPFKIVMGEDRNGNRGYACYAKESIQRIDVDFYYNPHEYWDNDQGVIRIRIPGGGFDEIPVSMNAYENRNYSNLVNDEIYTSSVVRFFKDYFGEELQQYKTFGACPMHIVGSFVYVNDYFSMDSDFFHGTGAGTIIPSTALPIGYYVDQFDEYLSNLNISGNFSGASYDMPGGNMYDLDFPKEWAHADRGQGYIPTVVIMSPYQAVNTLRLPNPVDEYGGDTAEYNFTSGGGDIYQDAYVGLRLTSHPYKDDEYYYYPDHAYDPMQLYVSPVMFPDNNMWGLNQSTPLNDYDIMPARLELTDTSSIARRAYLQSTPNLIMLDTPYINFPYYLDTGKEPRPITPAILEHPQRRVGPGAIQSGPQLTRNPFYSLLYQVPGYQACVNGDAFGRSPQTDYLRYRTPETDKFGSTPLTFLTGAAGGYDRGLYPFGVGRSDFAYYKDEGYNGFLYSDITLPKPGRGTQGYYPRVWRRLQPHVKKGEQYIAHVNPALASYHMSYEGGYRTGFTKMAGRFKYLGFNGIISFFERPGA